MTDPLLRARALVLHDLAARGYADPAAVSVVEEVLEQRRWWVQQWPEGADYVAGQVAQDVQDRLLETTGRWPLCTACTEGRADGGTAHELHIEPELGPDPHWVCEEAGLEVAALGELPADRPAT